MYRKTWIIFLVVCTVATLIPNTRADDGDGRIVNGQIVNIRQAPFAVQLRLADSDWTFCGGSLITPVNVVTAAHCVTTGDDIVVVGGVNSRTEQGVKRRVVDKRVPKEFSLTTMYRDIAVLQLDGPMVGANIGTIPLCSKPWTAGNQIAAYGWGRLSDDGDRSDKLRMVSLTTLSHAECLKRLGYYPENTDSMDCTHTLGKDFCKGDSGGPGVLNGELCGVISGNYGCADKFYPGVFTGVHTLGSYVANCINEMNRNLVG